MACGLCLPHCPTYNLLHDEAESPRGRLSLMLALAKNDLPFSAKLETHLARCLDCRACEKVCPSYVAYGLALDSARALIESQRAASARPANRSVALIQWLVEKPARMRRLGKLLRLYQGTGLQWLLQKSHALRLVGLNRLDAAVPKLQARKTFAEIYPAKNKPKGRIALFTGCQASLADQQVLAASIRLLNRLGYEVNVPPEQGCCGALHLHGGQTTKAAELMRRNIAAFANGSDAIVSVASGCAATLCEYEKYLEDDKSAEKFSGRIRDINQFLANAVWPENIAFHPLPKRIAVQDPCTLINVLRQKRQTVCLVAENPRRGNHPASGEQRLLRGRRHLPPDAGTDSRTIARAENRSSQAPCPGHPGDLEPGLRQLSGGRYARGRTGHRGHASGGSSRKTAQDLKLQALSLILMP